MLKKLIGTNRFYLLGIDGDVKVPFTRLDVINQQSCPNPELERIIDTPSVADIPQKLNVRHYN